MTKGCPLGHRNTCRSRSNAWPKISMKFGATWLVVAIPIARSTSGVNSIGPGIMSSFLSFIVVPAFLELCSAFH